jgi:hypothetical protein
MNTFALGRLHSVADVCTPPPALGETLVASLKSAQAASFPFRHLRLEHLLPPTVTAALHALPLAPPEAPVMGEPGACVAVRRRLRPSGPAAASVSRALVRAFAQDDVAGLIHRRTDVDVGACRVALTVTQEVDGYACEPRSGEGEARFRFVVGLSPMHQNDLGPDLYQGPQTWAMQLPWRPGTALGFAPAADTWHGFEPRMIRHLRACLVVDYLER